MSRTPTDWTVWLPKAFFLDWSDRTKWEHQLSDPTIWLPMGIFPEQVRERIVYNYSIRIAGTQGDIIGVGVPGSDNIIAKNIRSSVNDSGSSKMPNEYAKALEDISDIINRQLKDRQISEEQVKLINNRIEKLKNTMKV